MSPDQQVRLQLGIWQSRLIELNRRNPLYCLPARNRGIFPLSAPSTDKLCQHLASTRRNLDFVLRDKEATPAEDAPRLSAHDREADAEDFKKLNALRLRAASAIREQGINILYLVFGVLEWTDPANGEVVQSPIVLLPVGLERLPGGESLRLARIDGDIELNPTLVYRLGQPDVAVRLPELPEDEDFVPSKYLDAVRAALPKSRTWTVYDMAILGRFSFLKMAMYRDLDRQMDRACSHPIIEALAGNAAALARLPAIEVPALTGLDRAARGEAAHCVLDADPSQQRAVIAAKRGQSFVLQGPPGTGKTQTIANIIAECIASGKRVLFVSQKMAALDAVFKRLRDNRLHDLCLEAHSHKADKRALVEQLRVAYEAQRRQLDSPAVNPAVLGSVNERLAQVVQELHRRREPLGISLYEAAGKIALAADVPDLSFTLVNPHQIDDLQLTQLDELAHRLAQHHKLFAEAWTHPWRGVLADRFTLDLQNRVREALNDLRAIIVARAAHQAGQAAEFCGMPLPAKAWAVRKLVEIATLLARSPRPPVEWLTDADLAELRSTATRCRGDYAKFESSRNELNQAWSESLLSLPHSELWDRLTTRNEVRLRPLLGEGWQGAAAHSFNTLQASIQRSSDAANRLLRTVTAIASQCGLAPLLTVNFARHARKVAEIVGADLRPQQSWFAPGKAAELSRAAAEASPVAARYRAGRTLLADAYGDPLFSLDLSTLSQRFAGEYASPLRVLRPSYYRDRKALRACLRPGVALKQRTLADDVRTALEVVEARTWIDGHHASFEREFASHYEGTETDWEAVARSLKRQAELVALIGEPASPELVSLMVNAGPALADVRQLSEQLSTHLAELEQAVAELGQYLRLASLPFTDLPFSQAPLPDFVGWLSSVLADLDDFHGAYGAVQACCLGGEGLQPAIALSGLKLASILVQQEAAIVAESARLRQEYASFFGGLGTDWEAVLRGLEWSAQLREACAGELPEGLLIVASSGAPPLLADVGRAGMELADALAELDRQSGLLSEYFPPERLYVDEVPFGDAELSAIDRWLTIRLDRLPELEQWIDFQALCQECDRSGMLSFYETVVNRKPSAGQIVPAFRKRFYQLWFDYVCDAAPAVRQFRGENHRGLIEQFRRYDHEQIDTAAERIRSAVQQRRRGPAVAVGQMGALKRLIISKRLRSIRKILADIPDVLFQYKPCLLMSPLSVSLYLEAEAFQFDVVIFDEASQIFVEDALCSILRARQVIIAGDTEQLPPTAFFKSLSADPDAEEDAEDDASNYESILQAAGLLALSDPDSEALAAGNSGAQRFAEHELTWHYRSRHDTLIAFSKAHFYRRIVAFPAPTAKSAVSLVHVPNGIYHPGEGKRNNPLEAAELVAQVLAHARANPNHSIGVITFNEAQKATIEAFIEAQQREEPDLVQLLSEQGSEGFFVKNIENVQGDERDAIFLSIGFARTPSGPMSLNFGPVSKPGGERRLNVAVTRARLRMTVVSSILPGAIDEERTTNDGPKRLKEYLAYALSGGLSLAGEHRKPSDLEVAIERAVQRAGFATRSNVGRFGYDVSIGVVHPEKPDEFALGIECDGFIYRDAETVRARDRLREEVLQNLGWKLHRVWSCDWLHSPARELDRIVDAIQTSINPPEPVPIAPQRTVDFTLPERQDVRSSENGAHPLSAAAPASTAAPETLLATNLIPGTCCYEPPSLTVSWGRETFYDGSKAAQNLRSNLVLQVVESDGPLPQEAAIRQAAEAVGIGRIGPQVRDLIETAISQLETESRIDIRDGFLYIPGASRIPARVACSGTSDRPIENISVEEIGAVAIALLKVSFGMRHDELVQETARLFGYRSTSANTRDRIGEALSLLELDGRIDVRGGQVRSLET